MYVKTKALAWRTGLNPSKRKVVETKTASRSKGDLSANLIRSYYLPCVTGCSSRRNVQYARSFQEISVKSG